MPDFLLELFSEEIPARMQAAGAAELLRLALEGLGELAPVASRTFWTPRRIGFVLDGLPEGRADRTIETRGPRVGAPEQAVAGFLRSVGLDSIEQCEVRTTDKGSFYFAVRREAGRSIDEELTRLVPELLDRMSWPKSMRWADNTVRWVRPLHNILAILTDAAGTRVVPARWRIGEGRWLEANDSTCGHRFLAPDRFTVTGCTDYEEKLRERKVVLRAEARASAIVEAAARLADERQLRVREDAALLDEVSGLVEWPVVRLGTIEPRFMALPAEVLTTSMRTHQKYFACATADGSLAPVFVVVGNNETSDSGKQMVAGNERVLRARLSDAEFFWNLDRQSTLESRVPKLAERVFHAKLGSVRDKVGRMEGLAETLAPFVPGADPAAARRAVLLAKADLSSALVGEFPELQGIMGRYLALHDGESPEIAEAIARHYAPAGLTDPTPTAPLAVAAALADKLDTLAGFFAIGETPTGSKDPYALRRAALGVIRIVLDNGLRLPLRPVFERALALHAIQGAEPQKIVAALMEFLADRLKVALRDQGVRHDLIAAIFALGGEDDLVRLVARTRALQAFLESEDGANLLVAYRRAAKIVTIEEKKDGITYDGEPDYELLVAEEESYLRGILSDAMIHVLNDLKRESFSDAMKWLAVLREPVDKFFERVTVNVEDRRLRANRLRLLARIRAAFDRVADYSRIEG
ncbi:MAG TPA: glycine--tRNA ligase subunit beta [Stellaceae bacterium]|nr:glycine--tRNA ligase subunit beta [Stellaceae bacterium]